MALNIDNLLINRALSATQFDKSTGDVMYTLNQITDPSLEINGEQVAINDAMGVKVASFDRSKEVSFSASNAFINLGLAAAQSGSDKVVATDTDKLIVPVREILEVKEGKVTLANTPVESELISVNVMTKDGGKALGLVEADEAAEGKFKIEGKEITLDKVSVPDGTSVAVFYKKESASAIQIENNADCFAKAGEFWLEVLFVDPCNINVEYHGFLVLPSAKMSNETTIDFTNEATHAFTIEALQDYCSPNKTLYRIIVSE